MSEPSIPTGGAIPSPLWTENQRLKAANAELDAQLAATAARVEELVANLLRAYQENSTLAEEYNAIDDAFAAERERAERAEGEAAGLRAGYADLQAAAERADAENALLRLTIAGITAHGGSWAEARIEEAIGDE